MSTKTFVHKFGGWKEAEAKRWTNPNGSIGGIVAVTATIADDVFIHESCEVWPHASIWYGARIGPHASIGDGASIGPRASIGDGDWFMSCGPCGSRNAMWTAVYSVEHGLRWWAGCKRAVTTEKLTELVEESHAGTIHYDDYMAAIAFVVGHPGLKRAMAGEEGALHAH